MLRAIFLIVLASLIIIEGRIGLFKHFMVSNKRTEIGIIISLPEELNQKLEQFNTDIVNMLDDQRNIKNIYHISLGQALVEESEIKNIKQELEKLVEKEEYQNRVLELSPTAEIVGNNIFIYIKEQQALKKLEADVMDILRKHRDKTSTMKQYQDDLDNANLTEDEKNSLQRDGITNAGNNFKPHITVYYGPVHQAKHYHNFVTEEKLHDTFKQMKNEARFKEFLAKGNFQGRITVNRICIVSLGYHGNARQIINDFHFCAKLAYEK